MGQAEDAVAFAHSQLGKPYKFGAIGPDEYDCSGLVVAAYQHANPPIHLPHWTGALIGMGTEVAKGDLQPGDLVFPDAGHVQIFAGSNQIIEAQQSGVPVRQGPMWGFWRARRIVGDGKSVTDTIGDVLKNLPGPWSPIASTADVLRPIGMLAHVLTGPNLWKRVGAGVTGALLIGVGLLWMFRRPIEATGAAVGRAVGGVGSLAVQGAAFGVGANTGGLRAGNGGPGSAPPAPRRNPPRPPPAIAPRTSPLPPRPTSPGPSSGGGADYTSSLAIPKPDGSTTIFVGRARAPARGLPNVQSKPPSKGGKLH